MSLTSLLCTLVLLPLAQQPLLAQPAPGVVAPPQPQPEVAALVKQGLAAKTARKFGEALNLFEEALSKARGVGDRKGETTALNSIGTVYNATGQPQKALNFYNQTLILDRETGDSRGEAITLNNIASVYSGLGQLQKALDFYNQSLPLYGDVGDRKNKAIILNNIGTIYTKMGQLQKSLDFYNQALAFRREIGDKTGESTTLNGIGLIYSKMGQPQKALEFYSQALILHRENNSKSGESAILNNTGLAYSNMGQTQKALDFYNQSLALSRESGNKSDELISLNNIGSIYNKIGQPQKALEFYNQALTLHGETSGNVNLATILNNIGLIYSKIGQPQKALEFYNQALPLRKEFGDKVGEATTLNSIGLFYSRTAQPQKALDFYNQALSLCRETGDKAGEANTLDNIGSIYGKIGQPQKALEFYNQALPLRREVGDKVGEATTLNNIGSVYSERRQPQKALEFFNQALTLQRETGDKAGEANTLTNMALTEQPQGQFVQAGNHLRAALAIQEEIRESLGSSENKVSFLGSHLNTYHAYIDLLLDEHDTVAAFEWAQKTKARVLLDLMDSGKVDITKGTTAGEQARESELKRRIGQLNRQLVDVATGSASKAEKKACIQVVKEQTAQVQSDLAVFTDTLYAKYPDLARKRAARTVSLQEVPRFLPPDTALLEYVTLQGPGSSKNKRDRTVLFCVTTRDGKAVVTAYPITQTRAQLTQLANDFRAVCTDPKKDYRPQARALYALLVAPAAPQLAGKKRLVVCPDGPLWGLPFQALMTPGAKGRPSASHFLIEQYELDYSYSATGAQAALLAGQNLASNNLKSSAHKSTGTLLALANPDFDNPAHPQAVDISSSDSTPRPLTAGSRPLTAGSRPLTAGSRPITADSRPITVGSRLLTIDSRALTIESAIGTSLVSRSGGIAPLPGTQLEADAIHADFPSALIRTGAKAQESLAKAEAPRYRFLHFATHGFFNDASPLDSAIVLAQPPASGVGSTEDGLLTAREIFDLNWPAELVVLSACNTARGGQSAGEGVVGLSWALFVAGAPSQVLSQWAVADTSTAQLMKSFYTHIKARQSKGAALRGASLTLMKDGQHAHPYYWAPFVLIGDWR